MKNIHLLFVPLLAVLLCSFAPSDWVDFTSKEGRFKIKFPKQPAPSTQNVGDSKMPIKMHVFLYDASKYKDENLAYYVMYCDYPKDMVNSDFRDEIIDTIFKSSIEAAAANMNGTVVSINKNDYKEFPGRNSKFNFMDGQGVCYMKIFLIHSRMYILMAICEPKNDNNQSMDKFFNSFALLEPPKK